MFSSKNELYIMPSLNCIYQGMCIALSMFIVRFEEMIWWYLLKFVNYRISSYKALNSYNEKTAKMQCNVAKKSAFPCNNPTIYK